MIVLISTAVTVAALFATVGKPPYAKHHWHKHCEQTQQSEVSEQ